MLSTKGLTSAICAHMSPRLQVNAAQRRRSDPRISEKYGNEEFGWVECTVGDVAYEKDLVLAIIPPLPADEQAYAEQSGAAPGNLSPRCQLHEHHVS